MTTNSKVIYRQQVTFCGKARCHKCREGIGHGPYWYAYRTEHGVTTRTYVGRHLPPEVQAQVEAQKQQGISVSEESKRGRKSKEGSGRLVLTESSLSHVTVRIFVLGQFRVERRRGQQWLTITESSWQEQPLRTLLGYLLCSPTRTIRRRAVMSALWPNLEAAEAGAQLDRCVETLNNLLEPARNSRPRQSSRQSLPLLRYEGESLVLADQHRVWVDADAFEALLTHAHSAVPSHTQERLAVLEEAVALYAGDFLPEERALKAAIARRRSLHSRWIALLLEVAELRIGQGATADAIDTLNQLLVHDPLNEAAVQWLVIALARGHRRGEALRAYERFADTLRREYDSLPSEKTRAIYEAVLHNDEQTLFPDLPATASTEEMISAETPASVVHGITFATHHDKESRRDRDLSATENSDSVIPGYQVGRIHQSPLIGREQELRVLRDLLLATEATSSNALSNMENARLVATATARSHPRAGSIPLDTQRHAQCALLMGEAGIGKTRLAEEVSREAQQRGWVILWSRSYAQESGIPYRLWTEVVRKAIGLGLWQEEEARRYPSVYQPLITLLPELEPQLPPQQSAALVLEQEQSRLWDAFYQLLATASQQKPLVVVLDDLQWADGGSCQLLAHLARRVTSNPILFLGTCREDEMKSSNVPLQRLIAEMLREHTVTTLVIKPLTNEQIGTLVSHIPNLSADMVQHIQAQAAGNPYFAEELARTTPPTLPQTITAAFDHRLQHLSELCRSMLGNAAILGGAFDFPSICAMGIDKNGDGAADEDTVLDLLDEALQAGMLTEEGSGTQITYHFWHPLLVNHLYESLSLTRRTRLHRRAADILLVTHQGHQEEIAATITHHLIEGRADPTQIAFYAEMAGNRAYRLSAYAEAERHYRKAAEYAEQPVGTDLSRSLVSPYPLIATEIYPARPPVEHTRFVLLLERWAECLMVLGQFEEARNLYERILALRTRQPLLDKRSEAQVYALLWGEIERTWRYAGNKERVRECSERSEQVLHEAGVQGGPAWAKLRYQQSSLYWQEGRYEEAYQAAQEALNTFSMFELEREQLEQSTTQVITFKLQGPLTRIQRILAGDPVEMGRTYSLLGSIASGEGKHDEALAYLKQALEIFERYEQKRGIAHVTCNLGYIYLKRAEYEQARAAFNRSQRLAEQLGDTPLLSVIFSNLGELAFATGQLNEAEQWYRLALTLAERFNDREYMSRWSVGLVNVLLRIGQLDEAAARTLYALKIARSMHNSPCIGMALLALANVRVAQAQQAPKRLGRVRARLLKHASANIQRILSLERLEAETRSGAQTTQAQIARLQTTHK